MSDEAISYNNTEIATLNSTSLAMTISSYKIKTKNDIIGQL